MLGRPKVHVPLGVRYRTSRAIFRQSMQDLRNNRDLWFFPILASVFFLAMVGGIALVVMVAIPRFGSLIVDAGSAFAPLLALAMLPLFYPFAVVVSLLNAALCFALYERAEGRTCTRAEAWRRARSQLGPIARFNVIAMLVAGVFQLFGVLLQKLHVVPWLRTVVQLVGAYAWAAASYFVIPILAVERERRAIGAVRASMDIARSQWGKTAAGIVTIGLALMVPMLVIVVLFMLATMGLMALLFSGSPPYSRGSIAATMVVLAVAFIVPMLLVSIVAQAATVAYQTALYRFAKTGKVTDPYTKETLVDAWEPYRAPPA